MKIVLLLTSFCIYPLYGMNQSPTNCDWKRFSPEESNLSESKMMERDRTIIEESKSIEIHNPLPGVPLLFRSYHAKRMHTQQDKKSQISLEDVDRKTTVLFDLLNDKIIDVFNELERIDNHLKRIDSKVIAITKLINK